VRPTEHISKDVSSPARKTADDSSYEEENQDQEEAEKEEEGVKETAVSIEPETETETELLEGVLSHLLDDPEDQDPDSSSMNFVMLILIMMTALRTIRERIHLSWWTSMFFHLCQRRMMTSFHKKLALG
jgi:hypothetical protein